METLPFYTLFSLFTSFHTHFIFITLKIEDKISSLHFLQLSKLLFLFFLSLFHLIHCHHIYKFLLLKLFYHSSQFNCISLFISKCTNSPSKDSSCFSSYKTIKSCNVSPFSYRKCFSLLNVNCDPYFTWYLLFSSIPVLFILPILRWIFSQSRKYQPVLPKSILIHWLFSLFSIINPSFWFPPILISKVLPP